MFQHLTVVQRRYVAFIRYSICAVVIIATATKGSLIANINHTVSSRLYNRMYMENPQSVVHSKQELFSQSLRVRFVANNKNNTTFETIVALSSHPDWIVFHAQNQSFQVDERSVRFFIDDVRNDLFPRAQDAVAFPSTNTTDRTRIEGTPESGFIVDATLAASLIVDAFHAQKSVVDIPALYQEGSLYIFTKEGVQHLSRLSEGLSDFAQSPLGRAANIQKALREQLHGVVVQPNEQFSFNRAMEGSSGWFSASVIKEGGTIVSEPGGGICQATTTIFRAALLAGLPIISRANHSLYVGYYEEYGVGLDATVYKDKQDFVFKNDTQSPLVVFATYQGSKAIVQLYGVPDERTVQLSGPFFSSSQSAFGQPLGVKQIGWNYLVQYQDGQKVQNNFISTYATLPKILREKYKHTSGYDLLTQINMPKIPGRVTNNL